EEEEEEEEEEEAPEEEIIFEEVEKVEEIDLTEIEINKTYTEHLTLGNKLFNQRYYRAALEEYKAAYKLNQNSITPMIKLAETYLKLNDGRTAQKYFERALETSPENTEIKLGLVRSFLNQRAVERAKDLVWEMDLSYNSVKYYKGIILILYNDPEGAKNLFKQISEASDPPAETKLKEKADKFLNKYLTYSYFTEADPLYLRTLLAQAMTEVQEYSAAVSLLFEIINEKNNYRDAWILLGYSYLNLNKTNDAIDSLLQARELDEKNPKINFYLGLAYAANGENEKAITYLERAKSYGFEPLELVELRLAELYTEQLNFQDAAASYEVVLSKNKSNLSVFSNAIWIYIDYLKKPSRALKIAQEATLAFPNDEIAYNLLGWAHIANEDYADAKIALDNALKINDSYDAIYFNLGLLNEKQGHYLLAKEYYKQAYAMDGSNSIMNLAAERYNNLINIKDTFKADISSDSFPSPLMESPSLPL
ncbi:tetratricopeptide repeat protein, partial [Candidatus Peregrinibacteria bacterium]|nr:tetratricopeptide repeat protein [Candidatus Peregrinibacteria bacterium]